ncbi:DivIVA domain-containing protein [bacterium]|nr:DivIVA domain-containing protein [bacterium]
MLSPLEIKKYEFNKSIRGYESGEVRSFLEEIAIEMEYLNEQNRDLTAKLEKVNSEVVSYRNIEQNMKDALDNAKNALKGAKEDSKREADLLKREARLEAENIFRSAYKKSENLDREIESLKARRNNFVRKWRALLTSELEMLHLLEEVDSEFNDIKPDAQPDASEQEFAQQDEKTSDNGLEPINNHPGADSEDLIEEDTVSNNSHIETGNE